MYLPREGHNSRSRWVCLAAASILTVVLCGVLNLLSGFRFNYPAEFEKSNLISSVRLKVVEGQLVRVIAARTAVIRFCK